MQGAPRAMFVPLSLAVGFLDGGFVCVVEHAGSRAVVWLLRHVHLDDMPAPRPPEALRIAIGIAPLNWVRALSFERFRSGYERLLAGAIGFRWGLLTAYLASLRRV